MTVLVTGAAGAIGAAIVERFIQRGDQVLALDVRKPRFEDERVTAVAGDLRSPGCLDGIRSALVESGGATAVIAAHGTFGGSGPIESLKRGAVAELMDVNFSVVAHLLDATIDALRRRRGVFVVIASQAGLRGEPGASPYCASKWAVRAWAAASDTRLQGEGIRVHAVCPGRTTSPLLERALETFAQAEGMTRVEYENACRRQIPARRFGSPAEIAAAIEYLVASDFAPSTLVINGGEVPW